MARHQLSTYLLTYLFCFAAELRSLPSKERFGVVARMWSAAKASGEVELYEQKRAELAASSASATLTEEQKQKSLKKCTSQMYKQVR